MRLAPWSSLCRAERGKRRCGNRSSLQQAAAREMIGRHKPLLPLLARSHDEAQPKMIPDLPEKMKGAE
jgi:hypothetical protein